MNSLVPAISIIIPTYNRKAFLGKTIRSALNQTEPALEIIVVDDGSTDGTEAFIKEQFNNEVIYLKQENKERGAARNYGASVAKGDYIYFLDSDDLLYSDHIEKASNFLELHNNPSWFFQEYEVVEGSFSRQIMYDRRKPFKTLIQKGNFMSCHGVFLRSDIFSKHKFREDRTLSGSEDYELWLRLAARYPLLVHQCVTSALVQHPDRSVFNFDPKLLIERKNRFLSFISTDDVLMSKVQGRFSSVKENTYSYVSLHLAMCGFRRQSLAYLWKAIRIRPIALFSRRKLAIFKHLLINKNAES